MKNMLGRGACLAGALLACAALAETVRIDIEPGEYWWGGTVGGGWRMPIGADGYEERDLRIESEGNQCAPLLLSTRGRWVWCEDAFKYTFTNGVLTVETGAPPRRIGESMHPMDVFAGEEGGKSMSADTSTVAGAIPNIGITSYSKRMFAPIQTGRAPGASLRAAFEHCSRSFFPPKGMPRTDWFAQPVLNTWVEFNYDQNESGILVRNLLEEAKTRSEREARRILTYAIQRYASDCTYERTTATIPLPNDEMKGRIIGREGRNIRAIEAATGVSILIDDTPEAVVISCFDPVRKEVARQLMEKLINDGRIHPTRVEELVRKISKELDEELYQVGEAAVLETGIQGVPPQLIKLLGRLKYRYSFSQNVLKHSLETAYFMGMIAAELGLDEKKAKRIGLFHDIGKAIDHEVEGPHAQIGADLLRKCNEAKDVVNAVAAHHGEVEPESLYDILINACDTLSASRPGARSETTELYLKRLEQLESIAHEFSGVESCFALQAGREVRVVVTPEKISEGEAQMLAKDICARIEKEMTYPGQIKVTIIRETRSVEYAK